MTDLKPEKNHEDAWIEEKDDPGDARSRFYIEKCPIKGCKWERWKGACIWSYQDKTQVKRYFLHHVMRSSLDGHGLSHSEAVECLTKCEILEETETYEERVEARKEHAKRQQQKQEKAGAWKGKGAGTARQPPYPPPHKGKGKKGGKGKAWQEEPAWDGGCGEVKTEDWDEDWDGGGGWGKGGEAAAWDGDDGDPSWGKGGEGPFGLEAWGGWGVGKGKGSQVISLLVCFQQLDASF